MAEDDWCDASGQNTNGCETDNPGVDLCADTLGDDYRLPTRNEYEVLLGGNRCDGGNGETMCTEMFGYDEGRYWSSTISGSMAAYCALFNMGYVDPDSTSDLRNVRCPREGP
ncbi:MAG: hypothetical protein R6V85_08875 [Polyangia bacterium]